MTVKNENVNTATTVAGIAELKSTAQAAQNGAGCWSGDYTYAQTYAQSNYCTACGRRLTSGWNYCPGCGSPKVQGYSLPGANWGYAQPLGWPYSSGITITKTSGNTQ